MHGFSIPGLLGLLDADGRALRPTHVDDLALPPVAFGVKTISIGMFLRPGTEDQVVPWRGPMLHRTLEQFLADVFFGDLDVLLIDMPPGTGDAAISVGHLLPHAEVLVVTTPQPAAADVAVRTGLLARQLGQRVIGVVETMAPTTLRDGSTFAPFGSGGGHAVAARLSTAGNDVPAIGSIPFSNALQTGGDIGRPVVADHPDDPAARAFGRTRRGPLRAHPQPGRNEAARRTGLSAPHAQKEKGRMLASGPSSYLSLRLSGLRRRLSSRRARGRRPSSAHRSRSTRAPR